MKALFTLLFCCFPVFLNAAPTSVFDQTKNRTIPVEVYEPEVAESCDDTNRCPVVLISAGYGVSHTKYRFIAQAYLELGYLVVAVRHELPGDPPLSASGDLYETRQENWRRGAESLKVVRRVLKDQFSDFDFDRLKLVGHSNGGDISAWLANREPESIHTLVTLDHRRVPLPRVKGLRVLSLRATDFPADAGVIPSPEEQKALDMRVITIPNARHNDMSDDGPEWLKEQIYNAIKTFTAQPSP